jgi:hypothetical protein
LPGLKAFPFEHLLLHCGHFFLIPLWNYRLVVSYDVPGKRFNVKLHERLSTGNKYN